MQRQMLDVTKMYGSVTNLTVFIPQKHAHLPCMVRADDLPRAKQSPVFTELVVFPTLLAQKA
jgi:hypothetical protein